MLRKVWQLPHSFLPAPLIGIHLYPVDPLSMLLQRFFLQGLAQLLSKNLGNECFPQSLSGPNEDCVPQLSQKLESRCLTYGVYLSEMNLFLKGR